MSSPPTSIWVGLDGSVKHDQTAIVACTFDRGDEEGATGVASDLPAVTVSPLDFEDTIERCLLEIARALHRVRVLYDPYQLASVAQRLSGPAADGGVPADCRSAQVDGVQSLRAHQAPTL